METDSSNNRPVQYGQRPPAGRDRLLTVQELSAWLNVPVPTLYLWKYQGKLPFVKVERLLRFEQRAIDEWLAKKRVKSVVPPA